MHRRTHFPFLEFQIHRLVCKQDLHHSQQKVCQSRNWILRISLLLMHRRTCFPYLEFQIQWFVCIQGLLHNRRKVYQWIHWTLHIFLLLQTICTFCSCLANWGKCLCIQDLHHSQGKVYQSFRWILHMSSPLIPIIRKCCKLLGYLFRKFIGIQVLLRTEGRDFQSHNLSLGSFGLLEHIFSHIFVQLLDREEL